MDVLALVEEPSFPGCMIEVRPIGVLNMVDKGEADKKIIAVPNRNPRFEDVKSMGEIFPHVKREIEHFFAIYKELEGRVTKLNGWGNTRDARKMILESRKSYLASGRR